MTGLNLLQLDVLYAQHPFATVQKRKFKRRWRFKAVLTGEVNRAAISDGAITLRLEHEWGGRSFPVLYYDDPSVADLLHTAGVPALVRRCITLGEAVRRDRQWR